MRCRVSSRRLRISPAPTLPSTSTATAPISLAWVLRACASSSDARPCRPRRDRSPISRKCSHWPVVETELFFDIETDPMRDLCYLHGFVIREHGRSEQERFTGIFAAAATPAAERDAFAQAMALFRSYPGALVVHYSKYERTEYRKLAAQVSGCRGGSRDRSTCSRRRARSISTATWCGPRSEWPTHDFSIKSLAKFCGFSWRDPDPSGASSIEWFDQWAKRGDPRLRAAAARIQRG